MPNWKKVIVSGSNASLNSLIVDNGITGSLFGTASFAVSASQAISSSYTLSASYAATSSYATQFNVATSFTASGLNYPTADNGVKSFIQTDGAGNLSLQYVNTIHEEVKNGESTTIVAGTPLYVSGSVGANQIVYRADAGNPAKMPVVYIAGEDIPTNEAGLGIILGLIEGVNTTGYPAGTEVFVGVGGGWTSTRPTGSVIVQSLGIVSREGSGTSGKGIVLNPGPYNLPNINSGSIWVGNADSVPVAIPTSSIQNVVSSSFATNAANAISASYGATSSYADSFYVQNNAVISGSLIIYQNLTIFGSASITYISESTLNIGTNLITVNSDTPAVRFGGLAVIDSGSSPQKSGSWLFDSIQDRWIMIHQNPIGSAITSSIGIMGPETYNNLGNETQITFNRLTKGYSGASGEHIGDSQISDDGTTVSIPGKLIVTGSITGSLFGTASYATQALSSSFALTSSYVTTLNQSVTITGSLGVGTTGSAIVGRIDASNDVVAFATSDRALKENLKPIANALYKLDNIQGYTFDWKDDENLVAVHGFRGHDIGVIAQEIEEILPEVVITRDSGYKAVKYEKIVPFLIQCIKELKDEINELKGIEKPKKTRKTKPKNKPE